MTRVNSLRACVRALSAACLIALAGPSLAAAQRRYPTPKVYNPNVYNRTRRSMSNRAAARAALKRRKQRQKARRKALRRTVN